MGFKGQKFQVIFRPSLKVILWQVKHKVSLNYVSLPAFSSCLFPPPALTLSPASGVEAGDHHDIGLTEVEPVLQTSRHQFKGLQVLQGVHLEGLPQVDCREAGRGVKGFVW